MIPHSDEEQTSELSISTITADLRSVFSSVAWLAQAASITADIMDASKIPEVEDGIRYVPND